MVLEQTTTTLFLCIFLVTLQYSPCIATSIAPSPSTSQLDQARCEARNTPPSPIFQKYLGFAIDELKTSTLSNAHFKYYSSIDGYTPIVHASYLCQADITSKSCFDCVSRAAKAAQSDCSEWSTEAVVYEEECSFRYSDKSFYGRFDNASSYVDPLYEPLDSSKMNAEQFGKALNQTIESILADLRTNSKYGPKFKTDAAKVEGTTTTIYALGECTWDLYQEDCRLCVHDCASLLPAGKVGGRVMLPSCNFRYEMKQFYDDKALDIPSPSQPPPGRPGGRRSPPPPTPPPRRKGRVNRKAAAAGTGGGVAGLLIGGVLSWAYQEQKMKKTMQDSQDPPNDTEAGPDTSKEASNIPMDTETLADLANEAKEDRSDPSQANDEDMERRKRKPPPKMSNGAKKNNEKKSPKP